MGLFSKGVSILKTDGLQMFIKRIFLYSVVRIKRLFQKKDVENTIKWRDLKDKYKGKRVFVVGAGPSINHMPLYYLKDEYTICFNRINLLFERINWLPDFYLVTDDLKVKEIYNDINNEILDKVKYAFFPDLHPSNVNFKKYIKQRENILWLNTDSPDYTIDLPKLGINKTVTNGALQIMTYLGFSEIYMIGVDMAFSNREIDKKDKRNWKSNKNDDSNHFDPRYDGKGFNFRNPTLEDMLNYCNKGKVFFDQLDVKIYNATYGGNLDAYTRINFESLFKFSESEKEKLFLDMVYPDKKFKSFDEILNNVVILKEPEIRDVKYDFCVGTEILNDILPKYIDSHIPFGPFNSYYIFKYRL